MTGAGVSAAISRFTAALLRERGMDARHVPMGAFLCHTLEVAPQPGDMLVVFSQELCPNARLVLAHRGAFGPCVLVTGAASVVPELEQSDRIHVVRYRAEPESRTLLRLGGPLVAYVAAMQLVQAWAGAGLCYNGPMVASACLEAARQARRLMKRAPRGMLGASVTLIANGTYLDLVDNLRLKIVEGLFQPIAPACDGLNFAHGIFQSIYDRRGTLLLAMRHGSAVDAAILDRIEQMVDPKLHLVVPMPSVLPPPLCILEHEAFLNELVLENIRFSRSDQFQWPGKRADAPIYDIAAPLPSTELAAV
jgi:hypothetical protein